mmetsp:Transcript_8578/g.17469  ORF Transcript_8578/g.17469 Transcript_8578/m.17469 type:complete len:210 (+) Transcript_8578:2243-2872(+)
MIYQFLLATLRNRQRQRLTAMACDHPMMWLGRLSMLLIRSVLHNKTSRLDVSGSRYRSSLVYCILSRMDSYVLTQRKLPSFCWITRTSSTRHKLVKFLVKSLTPHSSRMRVLRQIRVAKVSLFVYCTTMLTPWNSRTFCLMMPSDCFYRASVCPERRRRLTASWKSLQSFIPDRMMMYSHPQTQPSSWHFPSLCCKRTYTILASNQRRE